MEENPSKNKRFVVPIFGVIVATLFAFLAFLPSQSPSAEQVCLEISFPVYLLNASAGVLLAI